MFFYLCVSVVHYVCSRMLTPCTKHFLNFCFLEPKLVSSASLKHCYYTHDYNCTTSQSPLEFQEIPLYYDVNDFLDFFHVYMFIQIVQSYYIFCIYNFISFCMYLLAFLQSCQ